MLQTKNWTPPATRDPIIRPVLDGRKKSKQELPFMCTALPLEEIYPPTKFRNHSEYNFGDMLRTKFKYENKQRAITLKLSKQELWFLCTALRLDEIYPPMKFHNGS